MEVVGPDRPSFRPTDDCEWGLHHHDNVVEHWLKTFQGPTFIQRFYIHLINSFILLPVSNSS